jgi:hypothetical protein
VNTELNREIHQNFEFLSKMTRNLLKDSWIQLIFKHVKHVGSIEGPQTLRLFVHFLSSPVPDPLPHTRVERIYKNLLFMEQKTTTVGSSNFTEISTRLSKCWYSVCTPALSCEGAQFESRSPPVLDWPVHRKRTVLFYTVPNIHYVLLIGNCISRNKTWKISAFVSGENCNNSLRQHSCIS